MKKACRLEVNADTVPHRKKTWFAYLSVEVRFEVNEMSVECFSAQLSNIERSPREQKRERRRA